MEMWNSTSARVWPPPPRFLRLPRPRRRRLFGKCRSRDRMSTGDSACRVCILACNGRVRLLARHAIKEGIEFADEIARWVGGNPLANISRGRFAHLLQADAIFPRSVHCFVEQLDRGSLG